MKSGDLKNVNKNNINNDFKVTMQILIEMELFGLKKIPMIYKNYFPFKF